MSFVQSIRRPRQWLGTIRTIRSISQASHAPSKRFIKSPFSLKGRCFSTEANVTDLPLKGVVAAVAGENHNEEEEAFNTMEAVLKQRYTAHIPDVHDASRRIARSKFGNDVNRARRYLKSATAPDVTHLRACAYLEMRVRHYDEARLILKELNRIYPTDISILTDLCLVEERAGNKTALAEYTQILQRMQNRVNAMQKEQTSNTNTKSSHFYTDSETPLPTPQSWEDGLFLDPRDRRAAMRDHYATAAKVTAKQPEVVIEWARREANEGYIDKAIQILQTSLKNYASPAGAGSLQLELAKYHFFLNAVPESTAALKAAMLDPSTKPQAVQMLAELSEIDGGSEAALELFQYVVDNEGDTTSSSSSPNTMLNYLDFLRSRGMTDLYQRVAADATVKYPGNRAIASHHIRALLRTQNYTQALTAINTMIESNPHSSFTYEYLIAACEESDPRVLNYVYYQAMQNAGDNALLLMQYGEFLEEMNELEAAREVFRKAYEVTPTDDLARSVIRMSIECGDYEEAGKLLDVLIDEYQYEVDMRDGKVVLNEDAERWRKRRVDMGEEVDIDGGLETATRMMPRLLADKAILAARRQHHEYAEELLENALSLDPSDPYLHLVAVEEVYEPQQRWDDILHVFRLLPEIDPRREYALEARSLRQNLLQTAIESDATNAQIYALYHVCDGSTRDFEGGQNDSVQMDLDYYGRDLFSMNEMNDGWDSFGYSHMKNIDRTKENELAAFRVGDEAVKKGEDLEDTRVLEFYASMPDTLKEAYCNYNWYEIPLMKEWLPNVPAAQPDETPIDWNAMRNEDGLLTVKYDKVFNGEGGVKISMKQLENLHDVLAKEYRTVPEDLREGEKQQAHAYELKSMDQLVREVKKNLGEKYFDFSAFDPDLKFPLERGDLLNSPLLKESLRWIKKAEGEEKEEKEKEERKKAW